MQVSDDPATLDLSNLYAIAGGDEMFVVALLSKMCKALPEAFKNMQAHCEMQDWSALKSAAHKAKSTFAYLGLEDMRNRLRDIEHGAGEGSSTERLPRMVDEAVVIGKEILTQLQAELAKRL